MDIETRELNFALLNFSCPNKIVTSHNSTNGEDGRYDIHEFQAGAITNFIRNLTIKHVMAHVAERQAR